jgi:ACT domain-containing protein
MADKQIVVLSAFGKDRTGLVAGVTRVLADNKVNIEDLSQTIMQDVFAMVMLLDISNANCGFEDLQKKLDDEGGKIGLQIRIQHKDIFEYMHRV